MPGGGDRGLGLGNAKMKETPVWEGGEESQGKIKESTDRGVGRGDATQHQPEAQANSVRFPILKGSDRDLKGIPLQGGCAGIAAVSTDTSAGKPHGAVPARGRAQCRGEAAVLLASAEVPIVTSES